MGHKGDKKQLSAGQWKSRKMLNTFWSILGQFVWIIPGKMLLVRAHICLELNCQKLKNFNNPFQSTKLTLSLSIDNKYKIFEKFYG